MLTHERAAELFATARCTYDGKPLQNNTRLKQRGDDYAVVLHGTDVVTILADGRYRLNDGGWPTMTTKDRINTYSPARVYSDRGVWYIDTPTTPADPEPDWSWDQDRAARRLWNAWRRRNRVEFANGIEVDANGNAAARDWEAERKAWLKRHGLRSYRGNVILFKATDAEYRSRHGATYTPGTTVVARDYAATTMCGAGLHFGPTMDVAASYHGSDPTFLKCRVPLDSLVPLDDKCKAQSCYVVGVVR